MSLDLRDDEWTVTQAFLVGFLAGTLAGVLTALSWIGGAGWIPS